MIDLLLVALLQVVAGEPAPPPSDSTEPTTASAPVTAEAPAAEPEEEAVRCRREPIVGTRLSRRICTTASQDRAAEADTRAMLQRAQSQMPLEGN